jgi:hypothetical protein
VGEASRCKGIFNVAIHFAPVYLDGFNRKIAVQRSQALQMRMAASFGTTQT